MMVAVGTSREHLKMPPFSEPATNKLLSSREKERQVPREKEVVVGDCVSM